MAAIGININGIQGLLFPVGVDSAQMAGPGIVQLNLTQIDFETNGVPNGSQKKLNLVGASPITITDDGTGDVTFALTTPITVAQGGTATALAPSTGQVLIAQSSTSYAPRTVSGDGVLSSAGVLTVTKTAGAAFAASATTDTTNATNITSGTLSAARLPATTSVSPSIRKITASASVTASDFTVLCDATSGSITVTLPTPVAGQILNVKKIDSSANAVTVSPASGTIDGAATQTLSTRYQYLQFQFDPSSGLWWII